MRDPLSFTHTTAPANNGSTYPLDSTCGTIQTPAAAPGTFRGRWAGGRVTGSYKNGNQAVTLTFECLTGVAGTSADWETDATADAGGVYTIAASTTKAINWLPPSADYRVKITAGATAPNSATSRLELVWDRSSGVS